MTIFGHIRRDKLPNKVTISECRTSINRYQISQPQEQLLDLASVFHPLNREVVAKETSIDLLIEKGAMLLAEG